MRTGTILLLVLICCFAGSAFGTERDDEGGLHGTDDEGVASCAVLGVGLAAAEPGDATESDDATAGATLLTETCDQEPEVEEPEEGSEVNNPPKKKKKPVRRKAWAGLTQKQKSFVQQCRKKADAGGSVCREMYSHGVVVRPPDPTADVFGETFSADNFATRPVCVWDPCAIWPRAVLSCPCPHCSKSDCVQTRLAKWIESPRYVVGLRECYLLDTKSYYCEKCNKWFRATNPDSVKLLPDICRANFPVFMGSQFAVDATCAVYISEHWAALGMARCAAMIRGWHEEFYCSEMLRYYCSLATLKSLDLELPAQGTARQDIRNYGNVVSGSDRLAVATAAVQREDEALAAVPENPKPTALKRLKGMGEGKLKKYKKEGITTIEGLASLKITASIAMKVTGNKVQRHALKTLRDNVAAAKLHLADAKESSAKKRKRASERPTPPLVLSQPTALAATTTHPVSVPAFPQPFPSFAEFGSYSLTAYITKLIAYTVAEHEAPFQDAMMGGLAGNILSCDQTFKVPGRVLAQVPGSKLKFKPATGLCSVVNEYGEVIWYAFVSKKESMNEIIPQLKKLKKQLETAYEVEHGKPLPPGENSLPFVIYVDNCCEVREKWQSVFPNTPVLLDVFHFCQRLDPCIKVETNHELAWRFRASLRKALCTCDKDDFKQEEERLRLAGKSTNYAEVAKGCRKYVLPPAALRKNFEACWGHWVSRDSILGKHRRAHQALLEHTNPECPKTGTPLQKAAIIKSLEALPPDLFHPDRAQKCFISSLHHICLKSTKVVDKQVVNAAGKKVVKKERAIDTSHTCDGSCTGCLSDPEDVNLNFRYTASTNAVTKKTTKAKKGFFTGRGSSPQENMHKWLRSFVGTVAQGAQMMSYKAKSFFSLWNQKRAQERKGSPGGLPSLNPQLGALLNSKAREAGMQSFPFPEVTTPAALKPGGNPALGFACVSPYFDAAASSIAAAKAAAAAAAGAAAGGPQLSAAGGGFPSSSGAGGNGFEGGGLLGLGAAAASLGAVVLNYTQKKDKKLATLGFARISCAGDGRCLQRSMAADQPLPGGITRNNVLWGHDGNILAYLRQFKRDAVLNMMDYVNGTGKYTTDGKPDDIMLIGFAGCADERWQGNSPEETFKKWMDGYIGAGADDAEYGDNLLAAALARHYGIALHYTCYKGDTTEIIAPLKFELFLPKVGERLRDLHLILEDLEFSGNHWEALVDCAPTTTGGISGADLDAAIADNRVSTNALANAIADAAMRTTFNDKALVPSLRPMRVALLKTSFDFIGEMSTLGALQPTPFEPTGSVGQAERERFHEMLVQKLFTGNNAEKAAGLWNARALEGYHQFNRGDADAVHYRAKLPKHFTDFYQQIKQQSDEVISNAGVGTEIKETQKVLHSLLKASRVSGPPAVTAAPPCRQGPLGAPPPLGVFPSNPGLNPVGGNLPGPLFVPAAVHTDRLTAGGAGGACAPYVQRYPPLQPPIKKREGGDGRLRCSGCDQLYRTVKHKKRKKGPNCVFQK